MTGSELPRETEALPFVAPCRLLKPTDPIEWLKLGLKDLKASPKQSLTQGLMICLLSYAVTAAALMWGNIGLYLGLVSGFVFVAPALAMTFYAISERLNQNQPITIKDSLCDAFSSWKRSLVLAVLLIVVLLIWARAANTLYVFYPKMNEPNLQDLAVFLSVGSVVGALFGLVVFAMAAFSLPMLMERRVDAVTAVITSINAVLRNKAAMFVWALMIVATVISGILTAWLSFIVVMPLIGHATWHAYQQTIDAGAWPKARTPHPNHPLSPTLRTEADH